MLDDSDYGVAWDHGAARLKLTDWVTDFAKYRFPAMNDVIVECLRRYEEEGRQGEP